MGSGKLVVSEESRGMPMDCLIPAAETFGKYQSQQVFQNGDKLGEHTLIPLFYPQSTFI